MNLESRVTLQALPVDDSQNSFQILPNPEGAIAALGWNLY